MKRGHPCMNNENVSFIYEDVSSSYFCRERIVLRDPKYYISLRIDLVTSSWIAPFADDDAFGNNCSALWLTITSESTIIEYYFVATPRYIAKFQKISF